MGPNMKDEQITKLVSKWQTRLKLDHWDVKLKIVNSSELMDGNVGSANYNYKYLQATIKLVRNHDGVPRNKAQLTNTAIHELMHLHLSGLDIIAGTPEHTAEEQAIEILSRVIMEGYEPTHK